jgi:hypothetical protein
LFSLIGCQAQIDPRESPYNWPAPDPDSPLIGTRWFFGVFGTQTIHFETAETVLFTEISGGTTRTSSHNYYYDKAIRNGMIGYLGRFSVTEDYMIITFHSYRNFGHSVNFARMEN